MGADIGSIQPSGGHTDTIVYVMTFPSAGGHIFRSQVSGAAASGTIPESSWQQLPFTGQAAALFGNPYAPNVLYTYDMSVSPGRVFSSATAGQTWNEETDLRRILTRNHEFLPTCNHAEELRQANYSCTLNNAFFDRNDANIRAVASITGAIAFSRDGGLHWISLNQAIDPNTRPSTVVYDSTVNPQTNTPSLYYDALNRSMTRIDAPFPTLESATYELYGIDAGHVALAVNATTGKTTELTREGDGVYRGYDDVFDSAVFGALSYHLQIDGQSTAQFTHTLTDAEKTAGVVVLAPGSDLSITKTAPDTAIAGTDLTYTITVTNNGPEGAQDVGIADTLPAEVTFVSATPSSGGVCTTPPAGGTGAVSCTWSGLTTPPGSHSVDIVVHVSSSVASGTVISNTATIVSLNPDPDGTNNTATATTGAITQADLAVTKNEAHDLVLPGTLLEYTIVVRNDGPSDAKNATTADTLPANTKLSFVSTPAGWVCTKPPGGTGTLACTVPSLPSGASATFVVGVRVNDGLPNGTKITNAVTVSSSSDWSDPTANNDLASTTAVSSLPVPALGATGLLACVLLLAGVAVRFLYRGWSAGM